MYLILMIFNNNELYFNNKIKLFIYDVLCYLCFIVYILY